MNCEGILQYVHVMLLMLTFISNCARVEITCGLYNVHYPAASLQGCSLTLQHACYYATAVYMYIHVTHMKIQGFHVVLAI